MDYKEKYEQALERAKYYHDRDNIQFLENIFPELKESEDERIRKQTLKVLNYYKDEEKSEGRMPTEIEECIVWLEKQAEQKPSWSESDETTKNNISHIIRQYDKISKRENKPCWYIGDCLLWMQNIKDRVQLQPKQEWCGGDEAHLHSLITHLEQWIERHPNTTGADIQGENITWLKSLRPQSQWRPSDLPHWEKSTLPNDNTTGFNSDYFCHKGYSINYKELFEKLPKDD